MTNFCKDCKYYNYSNFDHPICGHTSSQSQPNAVSGECYFQYCHDMRSWFGMCEPEGALFEPKKQSTPPPTTEYVKTRSYSWFKTFWK